MCIGSPKVRKMVLEYDQRVKAFRRFKYKTMPFGGVTLTPLCTSYGRNGKIWFPYACSASVYTALNNPHKNSDFGIHAFKSYVKAKEYNYGDIIGQIQVWGEIVEHITGYRAKKAKIVKLWVVKGNTELRNALIRAYGIPVGYFEPRVF